MKMKKIILFLVIFLLRSAFDVVECGKIIDCEGEYCFHFDTSPLVSLNTARNICKEKEMTVLEIFNKEIEKTFYEFRKNNNLERVEVWLGLERGPNEWRWLKSGLKKKVESGFDENLVNLVGCIIFSNENQKFKAQLPEKKLSRWICETNPKNQFCKSHGTTVKQKCFFVRSSNQKNITWYEAQNDCIGYKATLAEFDEEDEPRDMEKLHRDTPHWVGLVRMAYKWSDKGTPVLYSNWKGSSPSHTSNCGYLLANSSLWENKKCDLLRSVVCFKKNSTQNKTFDSKGSSGGPRIPTNWKMVLLILISVVVGTCLLIIVIKKLRKWKRSRQRRKMILETGNAS